MTKKPEDEREVDETTDDLVDEDQADEPTETGDLEPVEDQTMVLDDFEATEVTDQKADTEKTLVRGDFEPDHKPSSEPKPKSSRRVAPETPTPTPVVDAPDSSNVPRDATGPTIEGGRRPKADDPEYGTRTMSPGGTPVPFETTPGDSRLRKPSSQAPEEQRLDPDRMPELKGERLELLGKGSFGEVWRVRYIKNEEAWKYIPKRAEFKLDILREALITNSVAHPNVVRCRDIKEDDQHFIITMDLVRGKNLHEVVSDRGVFKPSLVCEFALQLASALQVAHTADPHPVLHLDLKPLNILLRRDEQTVMITDFGIAATLEGGPFELATGELRGTPYFMAPEQIGPRDLISDSGTYPPVGPGIDIWALGVTLYFLLTRRYPFRFRGDNVDCILTDKPQPLTEVAPYIPEEFWKIIEGTLRKDPRERFRSMADVEAAFKSYRDEVSCPACKQRVSFDRVQGICPTEDCPDPQRVVWLKRAILALRTGADHHSQCEFGPGEAQYEKVTQIADEAEAEPKLVKRAERLLQVLKSDRHDLEQRLDKIGALATEGKLLDALREIDAARKRFSASTELKERRLEQLDRVFELYDRVREKTRVAVRKAQFGEARELLGQVESFLEYPSSKRAIERREKKRNSRILNLSELYSYVDKREKGYLELEREIAEAVEAFDFKRAALLSERLSNRYPLPATENSARRFEELEQGYEFIKTISDDDLRRIVEEPHAPLTKRLELHRLGEVCERFENELGDENPDILSEIKARGKLALEAINRLETFMTELEETLESPQIRIGDRLSGVKTLCGIAEKTDLIAPGEKTRYQEERRELELVVGKAEERFQQARRLFKDGKFKDALYYFDQADELAPGHFNERDIEMYRLEAGQKSKLQSSLQDDRDDCAARIFASEVIDFEVVDEYLRIKRELLQLGIPETREVTEEWQELVARILDFQYKRLGEAASTKVRLDVLKQTREVILEFGPKLISSFRSASGPDLSVRLRDLISRVIGETEAPKASEVDDRISFYRSLLEELNQLRDVVRNLSGPDRQPMALLSEAFISLRDRVRTQRDAKAKLQTLLELHGQLANLTEDDDTHTLLKENIISIGQTLRRLNVERFLEKVVKILKRGAVPAVGVVAILIILFLSTSNSKSSVKRQHNRALVAKLLADYNLDPDLVEFEGELDGWVASLGRVEGAEEVANTENDASPVESRWADLQNLSAQRRQIAALANAKPEAEFRAKLEELQAEVDEKHFAQASQVLLARLAPILESASTLDLDDPQSPEGQARELAGLLARLIFPREPSKQADLLAAPEAKDTLDQLAAWTEKRALVIRIVELNRALYRDPSTRTDYAQNLATLLEGFRNTQLDPKLSVRANGKLETAILKQLASINSGLRFE